MRMQLNDAIQAHVQWLIALVDLMDEERIGEVDVVRVGRNDLCRIGMWLGEVEPEFGRLPEFVAVQSIHADFHRQAAKVIAACKLGQREDALRALNTLSGHNGHSDDFVQAVADLIDRLNAMGVTNEHIRRDLLPDPELVPLSAD